MRWCASSPSTSARMMRATEATDPGASPAGASAFLCCSSAAERDPHKVVVGGSTPPSTSKFCSQHRRAAGPYKPGRAARLAATAGLDTQDYNQTMAMARGNSGTTLRTSIAQARLLPWSPIPTPTPTELRRPPSEGGLRVFNSLRGCQCAVEAHADVCLLGTQEAAGANPAIGTRSPAKH